MKAFKKILFTWMFFTGTFIWAQPFISTQSHEGAVTSIFSFDSKASSDGSFYSAGKDGRGSHKRKIQKEGEEKKVKAEKK